MWHDFAIVHAEYLLQRLFIIQTLRLINRMKGKCSWCCSNNTNAQVEYLLYS